MIDLFQNFRWDIPEAQFAVRTKRRDEGPSAAGPRQGDGRARGVSRIRADDRAHSLSAVGLPEKVGIRIASKDAHECGLRTEARDLEGEICRVPSWQSLERGDVTLEVSARKGAHRWCDPIDDRVSHREHAADPTGHPSRLPKSLTLQFFDDELVIRRTSAVRTKETAVRVAHGIGPLPPAEPAEGVGDRHGAPQK